MNVLVLCAGRGQRFVDAGFREPKPLINVDGQLMVKRTTDSIPELSKESHHKLAFAVLSEHKDFGIEAELMDAYGHDIEFIWFDRVTRGNLETASWAIDKLVKSGKWEDTAPVLILDSDNAYNSNDLMGTLADLYIQHYGKDYGLICYFEPIDSKTHWCFAQVKSGRCVNLLEKNPAALAVGGKPMVGTFFFNSAKLFLNLASDILMMGQKTAGEFYMSQAVDLMLDYNMQVFAHQVTEVIPLGTPDYLKLFNRKLRIAIDLDDTINHCKKPGEEYGNEKLQDGVLETLCRWKAKGYYIIIHTARHMNTCHGNLGMALARQGLTTLEWLKKNNVPYDEIWWSKPHADLFVDDKGLRHRGDWKETEETIDRFARGEEL